MAEGRECVYKVLQEYVELRGQPSLEEDIIGNVEQGSLLQGTVHQIGEEPWLRLSSQMLPPPMGGVSADGELWTPITIVMSFGNIDMMEFVEEREREDPEEVLRKQREEEERQRREEEEQRRRWEEEERRRGEEEELRRREQEELQRLQELQEKALQAEASIRQASQTAEELLARPLKYEVVTQNPTYNAPLPLAEQGPSVDSSMEITGYPGSASWVRIDPKAKILGFEPGSEGWVPVRNFQPGRDLVLHALWPELQATKILPTSIDVSWPGVVPKKPYTSEYVVEWRPKADPPPSKASGRATSSRESVKVSGLPASEEVQLRVSVRVAVPGQNKSKEVKLSGPWIDFETPDPADTEGEGLYEVVNKLLMLRCEPSRKGRACGTLKNGHQVYGTPFLINDEPWIKLSPQPMPEGRDVTAEDSYWALTDASGTDLGLGVLMKRVKDGGPSEGSKLGLWKVVHDRVAVRSESSTESEALGFHRKGEQVKGPCVMVDGSEWLRIEFTVAVGVKPQEGWMLVDGKKVGLGRLLERIGDAEDTNAKASRNMPKRPKPPRPLTAPWLAAHGGLPIPPSAVREDLLPESEDVGMASQCSLVWVTPAGGGKEECYVAKRAVDMGDMGTPWKEYRFYTEVVKKAPQGKPTLLEGDMQVPRCMVANWKHGRGGGGDEKEHFLILMERLDKPDWGSWDVNAGISFEQAAEAVQALGRMHKAYQSEKMVEQLEWLGTTRFGSVDHLDGLQHFYGIQLNLHRGVISRFLPGKAMEAAESLGVSPHINFICQKMAEPPLTLCHGDYRPENLRFSTPGRPQKVAVFDWGLANVGRGFDDLCYFIMLCQPPERRKERDHELLRLYLEARGWSTDAEAMAEASKDIKASALVILAMILMTRLQTQNAGFFQGTRDMLTRMLSWTGQAIEDWQAWDVLPFYQPTET